MLSIVIPTYNRKNEIEQRVVELLPQLSHHVELIIIDNASDFNVEEYINHKIPDSVGKIQHIRNVANIGGSANVARCFEVSQHPWLWLLGDDDTVRADAVSVILNQIHQNNDDKALGGITFSTEIYANETDFHIQSFENLCGYLKNDKILCNSIFISAQLFRVEVARKHLKEGYQYLSTYCPHFVILMQSVLSGYKWIYSSNRVVHFSSPDPQKSWNPTTVSIGLPLLLEAIHKSPQLIKSLSEGLIHHIHNLKFSSGVRLILLSPHYSPKYWEIYYLRCLPLLKGRKYLQILFLIFFARICQEFSICRVVLGKIIQPFVNKQQENHGNDRL